MDILTLLELSDPGLSLGSVYAIIALGYTMVYGIAKCSTSPTATSSWWAPMSASSP